MKLELEPEEGRELLSLIVDRLTGEAGLSDQDRAALKRWRSEQMKAGSEGMRELTAKINADLERPAQLKSASKRRTARSGAGACCAFPRLQSVTAAEPASA
jgi:hypothetical protein